MRVKWLDAAPPSRRATSFAVYRVEGDASAIDVEDAANLVATLRTTGGTEQGWVDVGRRAGHALHVRGDRARPGVERDGAEPRAHVR